MHNGDSGLLDVVRSHFADTTGRAYEALTRADDAHRSLPWPSSTLLIDFQSLSPALPSFLNLTVMYSPITRVQTTYLSFSYDMLLLAQTLPHLTSPMS